MISLTACKNTQNAEGDTAIQPVKSYKTEAVSLLAPVTNLNMTNRGVRDIAVILIMTEEGGGMTEVTDK